MMLTLAATLLTPKIAGAPLRAIATPAAASAIRRQLDERTHCLVAEDGRSFGMTLAAGERVPGNGWYSISTQTGGLSARELFRFYRDPRRGVVTAYTISQGAALRDRILNTRDPWNIPAQLAEVVALWGPERLAVFAVVPSTEMDKTLFLASVVKTAARGPQPNPGVAWTSGGAVGTTVLRSALNNGKVQVYALKGAKTLFRLTFDPRGGAPAKGKMETLAPRSGPPAPPIAIDRSGSRFLYRGSGGSKLFEWSGKSRPVADPPGHVLRFYYTQERLFAVAEGSGSSVDLFEASIDRRKWAKLGPYAVYGQSASERYWLVERTTDGAWFLADFAPANPSPFP